MTKNPREKSAKIANLGIFGGQKVANLAILGKRKQREYLWF